MRRDRFVPGSSSAGFRHETDGNYRVMLLGVIIRRMLRICVALLFFLLLPMPNSHIPDGEKHTLLISFLHLGQWKGQRQYNGS